MDNDLSRLKILCKGLYILMVVVTVLMVIGGALMVGAVALEILDPGSVSSEAGATSTETILVLLVVIVAVAVGLVVVVMLMNIARSISRDYSPFTQKNMRRLQVIALVFLVMPLLTIPMLAFAMGDTSLVFDAVLVFSSVLAAAVFYCLALVFRYGAFLQNESDETL